MELGAFVVAGLAVILALVLFLPFSVKRVEEELEAFLLVMGAAAVTLTGAWSGRLVADALREPLLISAAVLVFGLLFRRARAGIRRRVAGLLRRLGAPAFLFALVAAVGLASSVITAIIAALVLVEILSAVRFPAENERKIAILGCYSIGLGAALTPVGEPLSTIAVSRLAGPPHEAGFFFLARLLGVWVALGVLACAAAASRFGGRQVAAEASLEQDVPETTRAILLRAARVYVFVGALVLLSHGFQPVVDLYLVRMPAAGLYWLNMISAVLDNATLAAAEISPKMSEGHLRFLLMGLLVSGGMLIPGNIPNIVCSKKLDISSRDWARIGVPFGLALLAAYFLALEVFARG